MAKKPAESPVSSLSTPIAEPEQLSTVLAALGPFRASHQVRVYRIDDEGHAQALKGGKFTGDKVDENIIVERFGGGEFSAHIVDAQGRIVRQIRVYGDSNATPTYVEPELSRPDGLGELKASLLSEVREIVRAAMPAASPAPAGGLDLNGMAALMTAMQSPLLSLLGRQAPGPSTPVAELIEGMQKLQGMVGLGAGGDDTDDDLNAAPVATVEETFMRELIGLGKEFVALQRDKRRPAAPAQPKHVPNQATRSSTPAAEPAPGPAKRSAIDRLVLVLGTNAAAEIETEITAQAVLDFISRNSAELNTAFDFQQPMADQLIKRAPGLAPHAAYLASVEAACKRIALEAAGAGQDDDDQDDQDDQDITGAGAGATQGDQQ